MLESAPGECGKKSVNTSTQLSSTIGAFSASEGSNLNFGEYLVSTDSLKLGCAPSPPRLLVGRSQDIENLKRLLSKQGPPSETGVVSLIGELLRRERAALGLTQQVLANRSGFGLRVIKKAEAGEPIRIQTAHSIAQALRKRLEDFVSPAHSGLAVQVIVAVRGLPGVGKTSTAAAIAHDGEIRQLFPDGILWASLGQRPDILSELGAWGRAIGVEGIDREKDKIHARRRLTTLLSEKRMLLIIDDIWRSEDALDIVVGGPQCAILATSRDTEIAEALAPTEEYLYVLKVLSNDAAVELLGKFAPAIVSQHAKEALELCNALERLPLALQVAGRLLRAEVRNDWGIIELLDELRDPAKLLGEKPPADMASETTPTVAALLRKSTDVLPDQARKCFAYLAPYAPKPATFDLIAMGASWRKAQPESKEMAEFLADRGLLEPVGGGRFWMHALLVAHARTLLSYPSPKDRLKENN